MKNNKYKIGNVICYIPTGKLFEIIDICSPSIWQLRKYVSNASSVPYYWTIPYNGDLNSDKNYKLVK